MTTTLDRSVSTSADWETDVQVYGEFEAFKERIQRVKQSGGSFTGLCPAHPDTNPSLSFTRGVHQKIVATCHAGCTFKDIREAVFPGWKERVGDQVLESQETIYPYQDDNGDELSQLVRGGNRKFWHRHWDDDKQKWINNLDGVPRVPYRLPELHNAIANNQTVFIVEGEKDADRLTKEGLTATTNPNGADNWKDEYSEYLKGARVVIIPDNDQAGRDHADNVLDSVQGTASQAAILKLTGLADKGDVTDWLDNEHTVHELVELANNALDQQPVGLRVYTFQDLGDLPATEYTIEGFIQKRGLNLLVGASGTGKTFAALDMALSIATNTTWHDHTVQPGRVLYLAAEGITGMRNRVDAWRQTHGKPELDQIWFSDHRANLRLAKDVNQIVQAVTHLRADIVVVDPLARFMEGADENSSKNMTEALTGLGRIQHETRATLIVPHHTGKEPKKGARGHSSLLAAVDHELTMKSPGTSIEIRVTKARDLAGGDYVHLYLEPIARSAVLQTAAPAHDQTGLSPDERRALQTLADIGDGATSTDWEQATGMEKSSFQRARKALSKDGLVDGGGGKGKPYQATSEGFEALGQPTQ